MNATEILSTELTREIPDVGHLTFEEHPVGSRMANGEIRSRSYRAYKLNGKRLVSVTSLLSAVLPAPGLIRWAEEQGARGAWQLAQDDLLPDDASDVMRAVRDAEVGADAAKQKGANRGVSIHELLREYLDTGSPPNPADHPAEHRPFIQGVVRWLVERKPTPLPDSIEQIVCHPELGYAGRMDLRATLTRDGVVQDLVIDAKTQARGRVYSKAIVQARMYAMADERCGGSPADGTLIVVFDAEGRYREVPGNATAETVKAAVAHYRAMGPIEQACR